MSKAAFTIVAVSTAAAASIGKVGLLAPPPSATPQPRPTTLPSARPPLTSRVILPRQTLPMAALLSTGMPLLTPEAVLALEASPQSASRPAQLTLPRPSPVTPAGALEARSSKSASTPEPWPPPPQTASPTPAESGQPRGEAPDVCAARRRRPRWSCLLYTSPSPRDKRQSRMPSSA